MINSEIKKSNSIKVKFTDGIFRPLEKINGIAENEILSIEIKPDLKSWRGSLSDIKTTSVDLQHKIKKMWK